MMRLWLWFALIGFILLVAAKPSSAEDNVAPNILLDVADAGDLHSNDGDRLVRQWRGGWGGGGGYGRKWGGGWRGGGWGGGGWGGGGWGSGGWRRRYYG